MSVGFIRAFLDRILRLAETVDAETESARTLRGECGERGLIESLFPARKRIECRAVRLRDESDERRRIVLRLDAVGGDAVELLKVRIKTQILREVEGVARSA